MGDKMSETNDSTYLQTYLEHIRSTMTIDALLTSFIFTALTLLLLELKDVTTLVSKATLLVLLIAFLLASLHLGILQMREALITRQAHISKVRVPKTPGFKIANLLGATIILLWSFSVVLMFFCRNLIYLGLISIVLVALSNMVYFIYVMIPSVKLIME